MDPNQILKSLDDQAAEFNFPVLDNAYVELAAARLSAFRSEVDWLVVFEILGFSTREVAFVDDLYAYGSCVSKGGLVGQAMPLIEAEEQPLVDKETNECIADWSNWSIKVRGTTMSFSPTLDDYKQAGISIVRGPGPGSLSEVELMRFLVHNLDEKLLYLGEQALLDHFSECKDMVKVLQTTKWQHPDVADGEQPSNNISIRSLVFALARQDFSVFSQGRPNTHWKFWVDNARGKATY